MASSVRVLPDHSKALRDLIDQLMADEVALGDAAVWAPTPGSTPLPAAQTYVVDGDADQTVGQFVVDVQFFAATYHEASRLSRIFDQRFMQYPHRVSSGDSTVLLDRVGAVSTPTEVQWIEDNSIRRFVATYSVSFRR